MVSDVFRTVTEHGGRVALATDCKGPAFKRYLALLDAGEFITATACGDDVEHGKPDPRLVGIALRKLALTGSNAVVVGDTPYDAEAGLEAGAKAAGVLTGGFSEDTLKEAGSFSIACDLRGLQPSLVSGAAEPRAQLTLLRSA
jgi:phosphoglycolate phosphatase-like HAD superfamily hydrolase